MNEETKNLCPHCGTKLWGDVTKCYKCHKKIRVHQGINKNIFKPNIGKVNCGKCNRKVKKMIGKESINFSSPSSLKTIYKDKAFRCSECGEYICGKCTVKKGFPGIPLSKAFMPSCPLCKGNLMMS